MARYLKVANVIAQDSRDEALTATVEALLKRVRHGGDAAVREMSVQFDKFDRANFRLSQSEIDACVNGLTRQERADVEYAQTQVRTFAQAQRASMLDIEVETQPGVVLGHTNVPIRNVGCYVPGGKYPLLASAHMTVLTAKVAGCSRVITCAPPFGGKMVLSV